MDELSGWHGHHETINGQKLIREMVTRDVNHPSIIWWSNGNEKGWNTELDGDFHKWDIQKRPVLHPQGNFSGYETMHYRSYGESNEYMRNRRYGCLQNSCTPSTTEEQEPDSTTTGR